MSDEKTRIIPRGKAESAPTEPQLVGDKIVFFCPNGHQVKVDTKYAGRAGQCSKCKVSVVIPRLGKRRPAQPEFAGIEETVPSEEAEAESSAEAETAPSEEAEAESQGDGPPAAEATGDAAPAEPPPAAEWRFVAEVEGSHAGFEPQPSGHAEDWPPPPPFGEPGQPAEHPAARLAARLWMERDQGGIFELHLSGGSVILPEWYEPNWSRGSHGLFASQAADGSITLTAVAWDTIEKIVVRQVPAVPDGMFE